MSHGTSVIAQAGIAAKRWAASFTSSALWGAGGRVGTKGEALPAVEKGREMLRHPYFSPCCFLSVYIHTYIMSGPGVGYQYPPQKVSWLRRDVLLFANTVGCTDDELQFLYVS